MATLQQPLRRCHRPSSAGPCPARAVATRPLPRCRAAAPQAGVAVVLEVTDSSFEQEVLCSSMPVLVDFWAPHCGPCRVIGPIVGELAAEYSGRLKCVKLNTSESPGTPFEVGIKSIPTLVLFKGGKKLDVLVGAVPKAVIVSAISKVL